MSKKSRLPQSPRHILVYDEDWKFIHSLCGPNGARADIGVGNFIRELIHSKVSELRAKYHGLLDTGEATNETKEAGQEQ